MLISIDTNILKTRPDHLRPLTDRERVAENLSNTRRQHPLARLAVVLGHLMARRISSRA